MSLVLVNLTGFQGGVEAEETALNIAEFTVRYFPEFKRKLPNRVGQTRGFAVPDKFSREVSMTGEISGTTGIMAASVTAGVAVAVANEIADYTAVGGGLYVDELTISQPREGWRSLDASLSSDPETA